MNEHLDQRGAGRFGVTALTRRVNATALTATLLSIGLAAGLLLVTSIARSGTPAESISVDAAAPTSSAASASPAGRAIPTVPGGAESPAIPTVPSGTVVPTEPPSVPPSVTPSVTPSLPVAPTQPAPVDSTTPTTEASSSPAEGASTTSPTGELCLSTFVGDTMTESLFDPNSAKLRPDQQPRLEDLSRTIFECGLQVRIRVIGHTDIRPTTFKGDNEALAIARAEAVRDYLIGLGHDPSIFEVEGRGDREPKVPGTDLASLAANRRVEVSVLSMA